MSGAEPEFRQMFAEDAATRLDKMGDQLLELERNPDQPEVLAEIFRDAHSLKGGAGMVGLKLVAATAHAMEDLLQQLRSGRLTATPAVTDALLAGIDGMRSLVQLSVVGGDEAAEAALSDRLIKRLRQSAGATPEATPMTEAVAPAIAESRPEPGVGAEIARAEAATMQITVQRLDQIDRLVGESAAAHLRVGQLLAEEMLADPETIAEYRELARLLGRLQEMTMRARMVPLANIAPNLRRVARDVARAAGKRIHWEVIGEDTEVDRKVLEQLLDPLLHLVRNAIDHGLESPEDRSAAGKPSQGLVRLHGIQRGSEIVISVSDDGHGIDLDRVRKAAERDGIETGSLSDAEALDLIFRSGLSTATKITEVSGRGVGLDVVRKNLEPIRGRVEVQSDRGRGSVFTIIVPITLTIVQCLVVESSGQRLALPLHSVVNLLPADSPEHQAGGRSLVMHGDSAVRLFSLAATLGSGPLDVGPIVVVRDGSTRMAFKVDRLVGQRDLVVKGLGRLLPRLDGVAGAGIEPDGAVIVVLDVAGLFARAQVTSGAGEEPEGAAHQPSVLVVDDALTVRELQRSILERAGYRVRVATDGKEAFGMLLQEPSDLVLTDLEMPLMDGFALTEAVRKNPSLAHLPVVILTSHDSEAERKRGLAAGADAYIIKSGFDQQSLLSLVEKLLLGGKA
jgi:two-component system chemotaxis sensor kinase CheA